MRKTFGQLASEGYTVTVRPDEDGISNITLTHRKRIIGFDDFPVTSAFDLVSESLKHGKSIEFIHAGSTEPSEVVDFVFITADEETLLCKLASIEQDLYLKVEHTGWEKADTKWLKGAPEEVQRLYKAANAKERPIYAKLSKLRKAALTQIEAESMKYINLLTERN